MLQPPQQRLWNAIALRRWDKVFSQEWDKFYCLATQMDINAPLFKPDTNHNGKALPLLHAYLYAMDQKRESRKSFRRKLMFMRILNADPLLVCENISPISIYLFKRSQMPCDFGDFCAQIGFTPDKRTTSLIAGHLQLIAMHLQFDILAYYWRMLTPAEKRAAPTDLLHYPFLFDTRLTIAAFQPAVAASPLMLNDMLQFMMDQMDQDPDARLQGITPLQRVARCRNTTTANIKELDFMQTLLDGGADPLLRDEDGWTARELSATAADFLADAEAHRRAMRYACIRVFLRWRLSRDLFRRILDRSFRYSVYRMRLYRMTMH